MPPVHDDIAEPKTHVLGNHMSTSSSVYSSVEEQHSFNSTPIPEEINQEQDQDFERQSDSSTIHNYTQQGGLPSENSVHTFQSYVTAHSGVDLNNNDTSIEIDDDATPIIQQGEISNNQFDIIDKTPILSESDETFPVKNDTADDDTSTNANSNNLQLPQQELSTKFKRLSMTLQQNIQQPTNDSQTFIMNFQHNVEKANQENTKRKSTYYNKINEALEDGSDSMAGNRHSLASSSSELSNQSLLNETSRPNSLYSSSKDSFVFKEDPPVRQDLVKKFEQLTTTSKASLSDKEKNDMVIEAQQNNDEKGLNIFYSGERKQTSTTNTNRISLSGSDMSIEEEEDLSTLFVRALHTFDSSTLQSEQDASICLSFEKNDLAFVHTIDESGWGEVTLITSLKRGWIPMNYFAMAIGDFEDDEGCYENGHYLRALFHACASFLINPLSHKNRRGKYTFSVRVINSVRDGVRILLQETDCLSRSNEIVTKRPVVRKYRKSLLADWYNLMVKANSYKGTYNFNKIEVLTLMVFQVTRKAVEFLEVWSTESRFIVKRENEEKLKSDLNSYPLLSNPPMAKQRVTELNCILYSYLGMIMGRLDLIEHNPAGCELLESIAHQIILLLRELLFISKTGSEFSSEKPADLDSSLDKLLSLVSDLVLGVKTLVARTLNEIEEDKKVGGAIPTKEYYYTQEGGDLLMVSSKMVGSISQTISSVRKLLDVTGDFKLSSERSYPDYSKIKIEPEQLIKKCSMDIARQQKENGGTIHSKRAPKTNKSSIRFSMVRSGKTGELGFTDEGTEFIQDVLEKDAPFSSAAEFQKFSNTETNDLKNIRHNIEDELLVDNQGNLLGASFKGLVFTLTNEDSPPEYFFVSTFFICFRSFANGVDLIEELLDRFEISKPHGDITDDVKIKNRRRLIAKMFQLWLESYWNQETDYQLLTTLNNFFNECLSNYLPIEAMRLIEAVAKLSSTPLIENQPRKNRSNKQIVNRKISAITKKDSFALTTDSSISERYSMVDGYELSKINTASSTASFMTSLPMPLGVGNQTSSSQSLLTKSQINTIEKVILTYRAILGSSWCDPTLIDPNNFYNLPLDHIISNWYNVCNQSWVLSNYRPNLLDFNGLEIAKQLTLIESHIFCAVKPEELLNDNYSAKRAHLKLAPNIRRSLLFTNCLSGYVLESTLQPNISHKMRVNIVKTWLKIAISCLYLRNFNSLAAILTALQSHLITRLQKVWSEISPKYQDLYEYLSGIVHPDKNYNIYRSKLRNFLVANEYNIPIVPYFSLFLQDLTFVSEGNPNYRKADTFLNQKLINIDKYLKITRIIADIEQLQIPYHDHLTKPNRKGFSFSLGNKNDKSEDYNINPLPEMQELILLELWKVCQLNKKEEDRAWKLSCMVQPRDTVH